MQLLLFWIIHLHCSLRTKNAKWFATTDQISTFQWLTAEKNQHAVKAAETLLVAWACSPTQLKHVYYQIWKLNWSKVKIPVYYLQVPPLLRQRIAWPFMSPPAIWKLHFFLFWRLEAKNAVVHFSNCFFLQSQVVRGNPLTMTSLCLYAVREDLWDLGTWQIHEAGNFEIKLMLGIIYRFTNTGVHLESQGYLPHFPRVQEHPPPPVVKKTNKKLNLSCYVCTEVTPAVKK